MSAHLFDFHGGGCGSERMKDGEKRMLTPLNPMRNVGLAIRGFFFFSFFLFHTASHQSDLSFQLLTAVLYVQTFMKGNTASPELS